jgi:pectate lyase
MNIKKQIFSILMVCITANLFAQSNTPAFPTAEGYGMLASGGRGGEVVEVTNLKDDAKGETKGSLRWALQQNIDKPTTIVFRVSGVINLVTDLRSKRTAGTTIAGQTAPGDGICIRGAKVNLGGSSNLIIRDLRFRIGLDENGKFIKGGSIGIENGSNFIIDHCTFGWSSEENMTIYDNKNTTIQWCILHEGLFSSGHGKGARSYGAQWGGETATCHHNLLANNVSRTPRFNGAKSNDKDVYFEYINNVNYNWGKQNSAYGADVLIDGKYRCNFINNYYKPGPARPGDEPSYFVESYFKPQENRTAKWYMSGNYIEGSAYKALNKDNAKGMDANGVPKSELLVNQPFKMSNSVKIESAKDAYKSVLAGAGAFPRDTVDRRVINEVRSGTASGKGTNPKYRHYDETPKDNPYYRVAKGIIDNPVLAFGDEAYPPYKTYNTITDNDHDGIDDAWEKSHGLNPDDSSDRNKVTISGYTCLEVYLNSLMGENIELKF